MVVTRIATDYHVFTTGDETPFVVLEHRDKRLPIQKAIVTSAGVIELHAADGIVETLGTPDLPCTPSVLNRIRNHHEGLLLVEVDPARAPDGINEQVLRSRLLRQDGYQHA